jgi:hypothetical protein
MHFKRGWSADAPTCLIIGEVLDATAFGVICASL